MTPNLFERIWGKRPPTMIKNSGSRSESRFNANRFNQ